MLKLCRNLAISKIPDFTRPYLSVFIDFMNSQHIERGANGHLSVRTNLYQKPNLQNVSQSYLRNNKYCTYHFEEMIIGVIFQQIQPYVITSGVIFEQVVLCIFVFEFWFRTRMISDLGLANGKKMLFYCIIIIIFMVNYKYTVSPTSILNPSHTKSLTKVKGILKSKSLLINFLKIYKRCNLQAVFYDSGKEHFKTYIGKTTHVIEIRGPWKRGLWVISLT